MHHEAVERMDVAVRALAAELYASTGTVGTRIGRISEANRRQLDLKGRLATRLRPQFGSRRTDSAGKQRDGEIEAAFRS
jgi:hypothetical protein